MMRTVLQARVSRLFCVVMLAFLAALLGGADPARAHNSLLDSSPKDGEVLTSQPATWSVTFDRPVPLASASAVVVNSDGVRSTLLSPRHGATDKTVVFDLPDTLSGKVSARWRLVGSDGHVVSGRVSFSIAVTTTTTIDQAGSATTTTTLAIPVDEVLDDEAFVAATPEAIRLSLRLINFLGVVLLGGLLFTELALAQGTILTVVGRRLALASAALLTFSPLAQYFVFVDDVKGATGTFSGALQDSLSLTLGSVFLFRTALGGLLFVLLREVARRGGFGNITQSAVTAASALYLLAMALGGHSRTEGTAWLGVPVNMLHTAAIVTWMGGLICVVFIVAPAGNASRALDVFNRFGKVAEKSMAVIIVTGVVQSARLHGGVVSIFTTPHGQLLVAKLLVFIFIVWLAARNRRVLFTSAGGAVDRPAVTRREIVMASLIEVGLGIVVLLVTAALVAASLS